MKNKQEEVRVTLNVKKSTADKFDLLRHGHESWNSFLESIFPIVAQSRKHIISQKLEELEKNLGEQG